jgi:Cu2+-exporting ATPase
MKHTYKITGMTCDNCKFKITDALQSVLGITQLEINREEGIADISMSEHVQTPLMQDVLNPLGDYTITMDMGASTRELDQKKNHILNFY